MQCNQCLVDQKYIMVFNGEIYNYVEIKNNLSKKNILITSN